MAKKVPFLPLIFFAVIACSPSEGAEAKADRKVVTPGIAIAPSKSGSKGEAVVATTSFVRILHAVPDASKIDVFVGSLKIASNRGFTGITSYFQLKSGKNTFKVVKAGQSSSVIVVESLNFGRGKYYTVALYGKKAPLLVSINESNGKSNDEKARVRAIHLAPGAPALLLTIPSTRGDLGYAKFISKPLEYGKSGSKLIAAKTVALQVRTEDGLIKEIPAMKFEAAKRYSAFIIGEIGGAKASALDILVKVAGNEKAALK